MNAKDSIALVDGVQQLVRAPGLCPVDRVWAHVKRSPANASGTGLPLDIPTSP